MFYTVVHMGLHVGSNDGMIEINDSSNLIIVQIVQSHAYNK